MEQSVLIVEDSILYFFLLIIISLGTFFLDAAQSAVKYTFLASAIRKCGGNEEKGNLLYTAYGSNGQVCSSLSHVRQLMF